jgi:AcrR family transcriptional regulator
VTNERRARPESDARRRARAERILDAASALILRWGYNKTTIDDVAREAGVAKGTIYLHWKTREELFTALMKRERVALADDFRRRMEAGGGDAALRTVLRHSALALMGRPLLKAVLLRDLDVIGKLAHSGEREEAHAERLAGFSAYLEALRAQGLIRTDQSLRVQLYLVSAIFMGFFLVSPLMPESLRLSDEELADLIADTTHRALETDLISPEARRAAALAFNQHMERDIAAAHEQFRKEVEP